MSPWLGAVTPFLTRTWEPDSKLGQRFFLCKPPVFPSRLLIFSGRANAFTEFYGSYRPVTRFPVSHSSEMPGGPWQVRQSRASIHRVSGMTQGYNQEKADVTLRASSRFTRIDAESRSVGWEVEIRPSHRLCQPPGGPWSPPVRWRSSPLFSGSILFTVVSIVPSAKSVSQIRSALASSSGVHSSRYCMAARNSPPAWTEFSLHRAMRTCQDLGGLSNVV